MTDPIRHTLEPQTLDEAAHILRAASGAYCYVCRRQASPEHITWKHLTVCGAHAEIAPMRETMNDVTEQEEAAGMKAIDRAGEYLAGIGKFDLRDLSDEELKQFNAHFICGYSEAMSEAVRTAPPF